MQNSEQGEWRPASPTDDRSDIFTALCARDCSPSSPAALLDGMCRLATDTLGCDCTHAVLLPPDQESCVVAATYGHTHEQWASLRGLTVPRGAVRDLLDRLQGDAILQGPTANLPDDVIPELPSRFGVTWSVYVPLRWDRELVGYQHGGYLGRTPPFSASDERVTSGFARLGAAAMATIRLLATFVDANKAAPSAPTGIDLRRTVTELEINLIQEALRRTRGNKQAAARLLGLKRTTLVAKMQRREMPTEAVAYQHSDA